MPGDQGDGHLEGHLQHDMSYHIMFRHVHDMSCHVISCYVTWTADLVSTDMLLRTLDLGKVDIQICRRRLNNEV